MTQEVDAKLREVFASITPQKAKTYRHYWKTITPTTNDDFFWRWLFAFLSIQSTWQNNVRAYESLRTNLAWKNSKQVLKDLLEESGVGLHNNRAKFIWSFWRAYRKQTDVLFRQGNEPWTDMRTRLVNLFDGIGIAKVSFALEMCYPMTSPLICVDTHMAKLYGIDCGKLKDSNYVEIENDWRLRAQDINIEPGIARHIYWDGVQKFPSPRYWTHVLEAKF